MKYNYPVKYAVMPIEAQTVWNIGVNELEGNTNVVGNIASKCYVTSERINYLEDGHQEKNYGVVFPYQRIFSSGGKLDYQRVYPKYNANKKCKNHTIVGEIYDSYEEAQAAALEKNDELLYHNLTLISATEEYQTSMQKINAVHNERMRAFKDIERKIEEATSDMQTNYKPNKQSVIVMFEDRDRILPMSIYSFIKMYKDELFYACSVTEEDYAKMEEQIKKTRILDERCSRKTECEYDQFRYLLANDNDQHIISIANDDTKDERGSYYLDYEEVLHYDDAMLPFPKNPALFRVASGIKVYTTETYKDIIDSYKNKTSFIKSEEETQKKLVK